MRPHSRDWEEGSKKQRDSSPEGGHERGHNMILGDWKFLHKTIEGFI
jgi:hypothetical protein